MILKKGLLTEFEKNYKTKIIRKAIFWGGRACFGWVGRSTANQHFLSSASEFGQTSVRGVQVNIGHDVHVQQHMQDTWRAYWRWYVGFTPEIDWTPCVK